MSRFLPALVLVLSLLPPGIGAQIAIPSDGSDGVLNLSGSGTTTIDLSLATIGSWSDPVAPEDAGKGIYDPTVWAVVYKYESVNVGSNRTLNFENHPTGAPVVWLVQNDVNISGTVDVGANLDEPGPGGFGGGLTGAGSGPGGAGIGRDDEFASSGSYGAVGMGVDPGSTYGNAKVFPLIGGSGGAYHPVGLRAGAGGGGAILIAASGSITVGGLVTAKGGEVDASTQSYPGGGAGGGIRLVASSVTGKGQIRALRGFSRSSTTFHYGGSGRIRIEANKISMPDAGSPAASLGPVDDPPLLFPVADTPVIRSIRLGGRDLPVDPEAQTYIPELFYPAAGDY